MSRTNRAICLFTVAILAIALAGFWALINISENAARRSGCKGDLKQLDVPFRNYRAEHGVMVPPFVTDDAGRPMHSWRVLILPHLDGSEFLAEYDLSQPWDSPHNLRVAAAPQYKHLRRFFGCAHAIDGTTHMVGVVGPGSYWNSLADYPPPASRPVGVIVLEYWRKPIQWTGPRDLSPAEAIAYVTALRREQAFPTRGLLYYGSDSGTYYMPPDVTDDELHRLFVNEEC